MLLEQHLHHNYSTLFSNTMINNIIIVTYQTPFRRLQGDLCYMFGFKWRNSYLQMREKTKNIRKARENERNQFSAELRRDRIEIKNFEMSQVAKFLTFTLVFGIVVSILSFKVECHDIVKIVKRSPTFVNAEHCGERISAFDFSSNSTKAEKTEFPWFVIVYKIDQISP